MAETGDFLERCRDVLRRGWIDAQEAAEAAPFVADTETVSRIERTVNSKTKTYRYVLLTQLVAKAANHSLDCRCVQRAGRTGRVRRANGGRQRGRAI